MTLPLTIVWLIACSNALNLIDGVDGLAAGVGLMALSVPLLDTGVSVVRRFLRL